jgi:hypothetical protein
MCVPHGTLQQPFYPVPVSCTHYANRLMECNSNLFTLFLSMYTYTLQQPPGHPVCASWNAITTFLLCSCLMYTLWQPPGHPVCASWNAIATLLPCSCLMYTLWQPPGHPVCASWNAIATLLPCSCLMYTPWQLPWHPVPQERNLFSNRFLSTEIHTYCFHICTVFPVISCENYIVQ